MRRNVKKQSRRLFYRLSKNVFWRIDRKNRLIFFGRGSSPGYDPYSDFSRERPWKNERFHTVVIGKGITDIHPFAFAFHQKVKEIECPSSLQRIGISAFEGCKKLIYIYRIPADAKIGRAAFKDTNGLLIYFDRNPLKAKLHEMYPKSAFTDHGRAFLMNGEFVFFAYEL